MPRLRTIKPGFFKNEDLCSLSPHHRLAFAGLWCWADRAGRLEDRPARLRAEIFPYENPDMNSILQDLAAAGFVKRYSTPAGNFIQIVKFSLHQNPHKTEKSSTIQECSEDHGASTVQAQCKDGELTVGATLSLGSGKLSLGSGETNNNHTTVRASPDVTDWSLRMMDRIRAMTLSWRGSYPKPLADAQYKKHRRQGSDAIGKIVRLDGRTEADVEDVIGWLEVEFPRNGFSWRQQVQSGAALRAKWDKIQDSRLAKPHPGGARIYDASKGYQDVSLAEQRRIEAEKEQAAKDRADAKRGELLIGWRQRLGLGPEIDDDEVMRQARVAAAARVPAPRGSQPQRLGEITRGRAG